MAQYGLTDEVAELKARMRPFSSATSSVSPYCAIFALLARPRSPARPR